MDDASLRFGEFLEYNYIVDINAIEADSTKTNVQKTSALKEVVAKTKNYSYFVNVGKQTSSNRDFAYRIDSLNEQQLTYFICECLRNAADALASY